MKIASKEIGLKTMVGTLTSLVFIVGLGWTGHKLYEAKADKIELVSGLELLETKVAGTLNEQVYQQYEVLIEEAQEEQINIKYDDAVVTPQDQEKIEKLQQRIEKYEKRQEKLK